MLFPETSCFKQADKSYVRVNDYCSLNRPIKIYLYPDLRVDPRYRDRGVIAR